MEQKVLRLSVNIGLWQYGAEDPVVEWEEERVKVLTVQECFLGGRRLKHRYSWLSNALNDQVSAFLSTLFFELIQATIDFRDVTSKLYNFVDLPQLLLALLDLCDLLLKLAILIDSHIREGAHQ